MVLDVATGESRKLTAHKAFEGYATYSPDGSHISYWYPRDGDPNNVNEIHVTTPAGGDGTDQTRAVDRNLVRAVWMPDGKSLLVGGHDGTRTALWLLPLGGVAKRLDLGEVSPSWGFWIDVSVGRDGAIAFAGSTPDRPTELYYLASATAPPRRLTDLNADVPARHLQRRGRRAGAGRDGRNRGARAARRGGHDAHRRLRMVVRRLHDHLAHRALSRVEGGRGRGGGDEPRGPVQHGRLQRAGALQLLQLRLPVDGESAPSVPGPVSHLLRRGDENTHADPVGR